MNIVEVRRLVQQSLTALGAGPAEPLWETLLVSEGRLEGYRFEFDGLRVFWFHRARTLEFYDSDWELLKLVEMARQPQAGRAA